MVAPRAPNQVGRVAARASEKVVLAVRFVSENLSVLLLRLFWATAWVLWTLLCSAWGTVLVLTRGPSVRELTPETEGKPTEAKEASEEPAPPVQHEEAEEEVNSNAVVAEVAEAAETDASLETNAAQDSETGYTSTDAAIANEDLILRCLRLPSKLSAEAANSACCRLEKAVAQVRAAGHRRARFSAQVEGEQCASVAVLGTAFHVREACKALAAQVEFDKEERELERFFMVHFTMRQSWDLPQDDELVEASIANDWVDLGSSGGGATPEGGCDEAEDKAGDEGTLEALRSPQEVLRQRLREVFLDREDIHIFMDDNPFASSQNTAVRVDFAGRLPDAWDAVSRVVLACEARGVYLSRRFEVLFWCPEELREPLESQVESALSHCQGAPERISRGSSGFGLTGCDLSGFEVLSDNVSAVLGGHTPPGWHRMEWTPHGAGAVPHLTY